MNYRQFVKENFHKLGDMPAKDKMRKIGEMWRKSGHSKGGSVVGGAAKRSRKGKGAGFLDDVVGGLGTAMKLAPLIGLGVKKRQRKQKGDTKGAGFFDDMVSGVSKGFAMPFQALSSIAGGEMPEGGGILSGVLGAMGLGMPEKTLKKHFGKMCNLEAKLHQGSKLTPKQHHNLKVYHNLHGAGFFDKLFSGAKKAVGAVVNNMDTIKKVVPEVVKFVPESVKEAVKQKAISKLPKSLQKIANA